MSSRYVRDSPEGGTHPSLHRAAVLSGLPSFKPQYLLQAQPSFPPKQAIIPENNLVWKFSQNSLSKMERGH